METPTYYKIIDDSGVDYNFLKAFSTEYGKSWKGQIVIGNENSDGLIVIKKPFNIPGYFVTDKKNVERVPNNSLTIE
jgi:hypothetical protein